MVLKKGVLNSFTSTIRHLQEDSFPNANQPLEVIFLSNAIVLQLQLHRDPLRGSFKVLIDAMDPVADGEFSLQHCQQPAEIQATVGATCSPKDCHQIPTTGVMACQSKMSLTFSWAFAPWIHPSTDTDHLLHSISSYGNSKVVQLTISNLWKQISQQFILVFFFIGLQKCLQVLVHTGSHVILPWLAQGPTVESSALRTRQALMNLYRSQLGERSKQWGIALVDGQCSLIMVDINSS